MSKKKQRRVEHSPFKEKINKLVSQVGDSRNSLGNSKILKEEQNCLEDAIYELTS